MARAAQKQKKKPAAPYSPAGESRSTLGEEALDFRVRNGNGYDSLSVATGKNRKAGKLKRTATRRDAMVNLASCEVEKIS